MRQQFPFLVPFQCVCVFHFRWIGLDWIGFILQVIISHAAAGLLGCLYVVVVPSTSGAYVISDLPPLLSATSQSGMRGHVTSNYSRL